MTGLKNIYRSNIGLAEARVNEVIKVILQKFDIEEANILSLIKDPEILNLSNDEKSLD